MSLVSPTSFLNIPPPHSLSHPKILPSNAPLLSLKPPPPPLWKKRKLTPQLTEKRVSFQSYTACCRSPPPHVLTEQFKVICVCMRVCEHQRLAVQQSVAAAQTVKVRVRKDLFLLKAKTILNVVSVQVCKQIRPWVGRAAAPRGLRTPWSESSWPSSLVSYQRRVPW